MRGADVKVLQVALKAKHWYSGAVDGEYGQLTAQAVHRAKYYLGYPKPDQVCGNLLFAYVAGKKTPARYRVTASLRRRKARKVALGTLLLREAVKHLGTKESPPETNRVSFAFWYGIIGSWCAMFVTFCAVKVGKFPGFKKGIRYAYVPYIVHDIRSGLNNWTLVHTSDVRPGDVVCYDWPGESRGTADHVGIFEKWIEVGKTFSAIEGNTSLNNNSNGGEVMRRERDVSNVQVFGRPH